MTSQAQAEALHELDRLHRKQQTFQSWLAGEQTSQGDYDQAVANLEAANPGLRVRYVDLLYRVGHVLAPDE